MKKKKIPISFIVNVLIVILAGIFLVLQFSKEEEKEGARHLRFFGEYSRDGITWQSYDEKKLSALNGDLYLRGNFGMQMPADSYVSFYAFHIDAEVALNGKELFSTDKKGICNARWISLKMPYVDGDDLFYFHLSNSHLMGNAQAYIHFLENIYYGELPEIRNAVEQRDFARRLMGMIAMGFAVALLCLALVFRVMHLKIDANLVPIAMMAFCYGGYLCFSSPSVALGIIRSSLIPAALFVCVIAALLELCVLLRECIPGRRREWATLIMSVQFLWLTWLIMGSCLRIIDLCDLLDFMIPMQIANIVFLLILGFCEWRFSLKQMPAIMLFCGSLFSVILLELLNEWLLLWPERFLLDVVIACFFFIYAVYGIVSVPLNFRKAEQLEKLSYDLQQSRIILAMSQIRAHFIFNILNAISGMCKYDPERADATLIRFARYLRGNIDVMQDDEKLEDFTNSLRHLQDYVALEQVRFGDRINLEIDAQVKDFQLPPLLLQPLVENAIKHGLNPKLLGGTITIRTRRQGDKIIITVEDDGVGFNVQSKREGSVGMDNVRFRLKQLAEGEMYVTSTEGVGTVVTVIVPEIKKE